MRRRKRTVFLKLQADAAFLLKISRTLQDRSPVQLLPTSGSVQALFVPRVALLSRRRVQSLNLHLEGVPSAGLDLLRPRLVDL